MLVGTREVDRALGQTWALENDVRGSAFFSECGNFRPYLSRRWAQGPMIMWLCMNPSSATDEVDDATSRKLTRHSRQLPFAFGGLFLLNVMDFRTTDPRHLPEGNETSPRNQRYIRKFASLSNTIVLAYGRLQNNPVWLAHAGNAVEACGDRAFQCVARNVDRSPRHPRRFPQHVGLLEFD